MGVGEAVWSTKIDEGKRRSHLKIHVYLGDPAHGTYLTYDLASIVQISLQKQGFKKEGAKIYFSFF